MASQLSLQDFWSGSESPISAQEERILFFLSSSPLTRKELSNACQIPLQTVCWRVRDLMKDHRVVICGRKQGMKTGEELLRKNEYYYPKII